MSNEPKRGGSTVIPCLHYRDATKAIEWLCSVFGFEKQLVVPKEDGSIIHAQLTLGDGMVMLGPASTDNEFGRLIKQPDDIGGLETQSPYLIVENADLVYHKAKAAGAQMVIEIENEDYGGRL